MNRYIVSRLSKETNYDSLLFINMTINHEKKNKYESMNIMILENPFFSQEKKEEMFSLFCKSQKVYHGFNSLARHFKRKKAVVPNNTEDLIGNNLKDLNDSLKITLLEDNALYTFRITDLLNIWTTTLTDSCGTSPTPRFPKNPYTNKVFGIYNLYNIYLHVILNTSLCMPPIITWFIKLHCDVKTFRKNYYPFLREKALQNHLIDSPFSILYFDIVSMINANPTLFKYRKIASTLSTTANKIKAVHLFKPILRVYLQSTSSCNPFIRKEKYDEFIRQVKKFMKNNPTFGRKIVGAKGHSAVSRGLNFLLLGPGLRWHYDSSDDSSDDSSSDGVEEGDSTSISSADDMDLSV